MSSINYFKHPTYVDNQKWVSESRIQPNCHVNSYAAFVRWTHPNYGCSLDVEVLNSPEFIQFFRNLEIKDMAKFADAVTVAYGPETPRSNKPLVKEDARYFNATAIAGLAYMYELSSSSDDKEFIQGLIDEWIKHA